MLLLDHAHRGACLVSFESLCVAPLGASDYLTLSKRFHTLAISGVPIFTPQQHNELRRFVTFMDVWYDAGRGLLLSADGDLTDLFAALQPAAMQDATDDPTQPVDRGGARAASSHGLHDLHGARGPAAETAPSIRVRGEGGSSSGWATTFMGDGSEWSATGRLGVSLAALSGLQEASFAQRRAASRLREMVGGAAASTAGTANS